MSREWHRYAPIELPSPVLSLLPGPTGVWAGGLGGVALYSLREGWKPLISGLPLRSVAALAFDSNYLIAGGAGGIARSFDGGSTWEQAAVQSGAEAITAMALSPNFAQDGTAIAATLDSGVLRTVDQGRNWLSANFGLLSQEAMSVLWSQGETVIVATSSGIYRSPNAGRAWRPCTGTEGMAVASLISLPDGTLLAAQEVGGLLRSTDNGSTWAPFGELPDDIRTGMLLAIPQGGVLLGSAEHGILLSNDGGNTWNKSLDATALSLAADEQTVYAGTDAGVAMSKDQGKTWSDVMMSPLYDLRRLLIVDGKPLVAGINSPSVIGNEGGSWDVLEKTPLPLTCITVAPDGSVFASSSDGLFRSRDGGRSWTSVIEGEDGCITQMTFLPDGTGWAGATQASHLLRTKDCGESWEKIESPFGVLSLVALQAVPSSLIAMSGSVMAATFDTRQQEVVIWTSDDGGASWLRRGDAYTTWPAVATAGKPPILTIGNVISVQQPGGRWNESSLGEAGLRRVATEDKLLFALATNGVWRSDDNGASWRRDDQGLPVAQVMDIDLKAGTLYVLLAGGEVWSRPV